MPAPVASAPAQLSSPPVAVPIVYSQSVYKPIVSSNLVMLKSDAPSEEPEVPLSYGSSDDNWALARIRRRTATETEPARELPADGGKGVHVWMIDSGFDQSYNDEYALRPIIETEFTPGLGAQDTTKGHGTQVASNICSKKYGVAKAAQLHVIAVGTEGPLKEAFQYVIDKVKAMDANNPEKRVRHIIQLSITYQTPDFLDSVIRDANDANIVVVNSAGNGRDNACNYSPGSITGKVPNILTVGSISKGDTISDFTSRGKCVNIFAPGERVPVFKAREHNARVVGIGTSFSAPLTSGVVAIYLSQRVYTTAGQVVQDIIRNATPLSAYGQRIENAGIVYAFP
ncbi:peptidase S8/S53 domain-containing protein [Syncephalis fuscata]|nr:peptidase S8/S53 domain-containing protein [Syncephalis fuscata]